MNVKNNLVELLNQISLGLKSVSDTPHLDAELLLMQATQKPKSFLFSHSETHLNPEQFALFKNSFTRRKNGEPMAYILGSKEFWSLELKVTPDVLIPRPETELLVEWTLDHLPKKQELLLADLGVGSGAIALALASERSHWEIHATDTSKAALEIAQYNANQYHLNNIQFYLGSWCHALPENKYDTILSNPPYVADNDPHLQNLKFEPQAALKGGPDGLDAIRIIISEAKNYLISGGYLIIEHGFNQREAIMDLMTQAGYKSVQDHEDLAGLPRFATGLWE